MRIDASCVQRSTRSRSRAFCWTKRTSLASTTTEPGRRSFSLTEEFTVGQARKSTLLVAGVLALLGGWQIHRSHSTAAFAFGVAAGALLVCAASPVAAV